MPELTTSERIAAGYALADVHSWAGIAWRSLGSATRSDVLASVDELAKRLEEVRTLLAGTEEGVRS